MSALTLRLPNSLHEALKNASESDNVSVNQFISIAVAEKLSALKTYDLIAIRSERADKDKFLRAMSEVPKGEIVKGDEK